MCPSSWPKLFEYSDKKSKDFVADESDALCIADMWTLSFLAALVRGTYPIAPTLNPPVAIYRPTQVILYIKKMPRMPNVHISEYTFIRNIALQLEYIEYDCF